MAYLRKKPNSINWIAVFRQNVKKTYKSTRIEHTTGDAEKDATNKAAAQRIADLFGKAARRELIKKELHLILDEIIDDAL
jgi:hypothetical protein